MRTFVLNTPWEFRGISSLPGVTYDKRLKKNTYTGERLPDMLLPFASEDYSWERWLEDELNRSVLPIAPVNPALRMKPRPHQLEGGKRIAQAVQAGYRGFLEADGVGLGKTITCLLGAYAAAKIKGFTVKRPAKVLIVCPKSAMPHWSRTLHALGMDNMRVAIINYDRTKSLLAAPDSAKKAKTTRTRNKRVASGGTPLVAWDIIIADESHKLKGIESSQRAKAFNRIGRYADANEKAPFIIWATATPGQNPLEVGYLAPLVGQFLQKGKLTMDKWGAFLMQEGYHVTESKKKAGEHYWIRVRPGVDEATVKKGRREDAQRMRNILFDPDFPSIRRMPEDMAGWPLVQRIPFEQELTYSQKELYAKAWSEFCALLKMAKRGRDSQSALVAQLRFRQKCSLLRAPDTADFILDLLENNYQVAVSVFFRDSIDAMAKVLDAKGIPWAEVSGRTDADGTRESERLKFQRGEARVVFFTVEEAISLHAGEVLPDGTYATKTPRATVIHDVRYSSLSCIQIEGRAHRDGQHANAYYAFGHNTVEEKIIRRMLANMATMKTMSGDDEALIAEIETLLENEALKSTVL